MTKLFRALADADLDRAVSVAREIIDTENRRGHQTAVSTLRSALEPNGLRDGSSRFVSGDGSCSTAVRSALSELAADVTLDRVMLTKPVRSAVTEFVTEWQHRDELAKHSIHHRTKVLL